MKPRYSVMTYKFLRKRPVPCQVTATEVIENAKWNGLKLHGAAIFRRCDQRNHSHGDLEMKKKEMEQYTTQ